MYNTLNNSKYQHIIIELQKIHAESCFDHITMTQILDLVCCHFWILESFFFYSISFALKWLIVVNLPTHYWLLSVCVWEFLLIFNLALSSLSFALLSYNFIGANKKCVMVLKIFLNPAVLMLSLIKCYVPQKSLCVPQLSL